MTTPFHYEPHNTTVAVRLIRDSPGSPCLDGRGGVLYWSWSEEACEAVFQPSDQWDWLNGRSAPPFAY
jgi:hypothetical protein